MSFPTFDAASVEGLEIKSPEDLSSLSLVISKGRQWKVIKSQSNEASPSNQTSLSGEELRAIMHSVANEQSASPVKTQHFTTLDYIALRHNPSYKLFCRSIHGFKKS